MTKTTKKGVDIMDRIFFNKYKPLSRLGEGSFGKVFSALNMETNEQFALKMEPREKGQSPLEAEAYILSYLKSPGIPEVKSYGYSNEYNVLVMELLDKSLDVLFEENGKKFSIKTVCMLADQMLQRLEFIHLKNLLHRDLKPNKFAMGRKEKSHLVYLIDFSLAKKFRSKGKHIKYSEGNKLVGTARYASINALKGCEQSRRDDLESLAYVIIYFIRGYLPWQGLKVDNKEEKYRKIIETKQDITPEELCKGLPKELEEFVRYTKLMAFEAEPDYFYLRGLFKMLTVTEGFVMDFKFDWLKFTPELNEVGNCANYENSAEERKNTETEDGVKGQELFTLQNCNTITNSPVQNLNQSDKEQKNDKDETKMMENPFIDKSEEKEKQEENIDEQKEKEQKEENKEEEKKEEKSKEKKEEKKKDCTIF